MADWNTIFEAHASAAVDARPKGRQIDLDRLAETVAARSPLYEEDAEHGLPPLNLDRSPAQSRPGQSGPRFDFEP